MPGPFDYRIDVPSPLANIQAGMAFGDQMRARAAQRASAEYQRQTDQMIGGLNEDSTSQDYFDISMRQKDPKARQETRETGLEIDARQKEVAISSAVQGINMLRTNHELFIAEAEIRAEAAKNKGDLEGEQHYLTMAKLAAEEEGRSIVRDSLKFSLLELGEEGRATLDSLDKHLASKADVKLTEKEIKALDNEIGIKEVELSNMTDKDSLPYRKLEAEIEELKAKTGKTEAEESKIEVETETIQKKLDDMTDKDSMAYRILEADLEYKKAQTGKTDAERKDIELKSENENNLIIENVKKLQKEYENIGKLVGEDKMKAERTVRQDWMKHSETTRFAQSQLKRVFAGAAQKSGVGDMAMVFAFMKMLDPGSVVRESEYMRAADASGYWAKVEMLKAKMVNGRFIREEDKARFVQLAREFTEDVEEEGKAVEKVLRDTAVEFGLSEERIFPDFKYTEDEEEYQKEFAAWDAQERSTQESTTGSQPGQRPSYMR